MSQRHQVSRRRSFGRRQHELRERLEHGRRWEPDEPEDPTWRAGAADARDSLLVLDRTGRRAQLGVSG